MQPTADFDPARLARSLLRRSRQGALATLMAGTGAPMHVPGRKRHNFAVRRFVVEAEDRIGRSRDVDLAHRSVLADSAFEADDPCTRARMAASVSLERKMAIGTGWVVRLPTLGPPPVLRPTPGRGRSPGLAPRRLDPILLR